MNILVTAATEAELAIVKQFADNEAFSNVIFAVTGVGILNTCYNLMDLLVKSRPDLIIQLGIAGAFTQIDPGIVTVVQQDMHGDLGVEEEGVFKDIFDMKLEAGNNTFTGKTLVNTHLKLLQQTGLQKVIGITVNEVTTRKNRIAQLTEKYRPDVESMEGAALHYVGLRQGIPFLQVRAISNSVGDRNKSNWLIRPAIEAYSVWMNNFLSQHHHSSNNLL